MNALEQLQAYLGRLERRIRGLVFWRGAALVAIASLIATVLLVLLTNRLAFSPASVIAARILLGLSVALAVAFGLVVPVLTITRIHAARAAERRRPEIEQRLLTVAERSARDPENPFLELLAADTVQRLEGSDAGGVVSGRKLAAFAALAAATAGVLVWLVTAGPGYWGHGAALLWARPPRAEAQPYYEILVHPGNRTLRRGASQLITAQLRSFQVQQARLLAKYRSAAKWEAAAMQPEASGPGWQFLLAGLPETVDYYVEAGNLRSKTSTLEVVDLPGVKRIRVTYRYPRWTGLPDAVEDPGGDLRAVEGTEAEVAIETDKPLANGRLVLDDGAGIALQSGPGNWRSARLVIQKDGRYHIAAAEREETVRLSEDYFIEAEKDSPPTVRLARPGRDARVSPIEEVTVEVAADDDFGLQDLTLHYAVNGGPEKTVPVLPRKGLREGDGSTLLYLEDYKLVPGDIVSLYATARDARSSSNTDIFFLEAQPFEREYSQSQQMGGGEGAGGSQSQQQISQRQKEIIAATWNQMRSRDRASAAENAKFLSDMQTKLRDQARSLATRMTRRELAGANQEFQSFSENMQKAAEAMGPAAEKLKGMQWRDALPPEQKALQHLLRAEALFRQIQIAFGNRQGGRGGAGGGGMGRDLENLFDLELDTEKNQYETGQRAASGEQRAREIEEALQRLEQLARRQQELAQQARQNRPSFEQRWQQELLRREAEQLQQRMEQLTRGGSSQQAAQRGASASERLRSPQERLRAMSGGGQGTPDERLRQALERLEQATRDMRSAGRPQSSEAESRRAAERLQEARDLLRGMRSQQAAERMEDMTKRAEELARRQQEFANRLARTFPPPPPDARPPAPNWQQAEELSREKLEMLEELQRLEREMQESSRELAGSQRSASARLREALGEMQKGELSLRMRYAAEMLRRGMGRFLPPREAPVTAGLTQLRDQLRDAQSALDRAPAAGRDLERALADVERLRRGLQGGARGGEQYRGGGGRRTEFSAMNRGDWQPQEPGGVIPRPGDPATAYREGLHDLSQLRQALRDYPEVAGDLQQLLREMEGLDPRRFPGNPQLLEQMRAQLLPRLENLELQLRRKLEEGSGGNVRSGASEPVPSGYADAVAEYFRRLSKGR